ncbi:MULTISPECIES: type III secretion system chaperone [Paracoccaceae]|jgi:hypothetical protein|uniref:type III secretion system chaperone n=1 Tax=Rhodobacterales TaxID=204455 RepID=UPI001B23E0AF|nr:type III secretion system chaperone [Boseongicola sp. H5]MBO6604309.1 hypothetical protein [Roseicyclus sp.]MBO6624621.1 hypothetical protein [Roseicyclus sp.]MBO6921613.1 hypothetical protein [Roseicyclus sp.]
MLIRAFFLVAVLAATPLAAQQADPPMTPERVAAILLALDPDAAASGQGVELTIEDVPVLVVMDQAANRMRAMVPVASADALSEADLARVMQANFDTALDARYAIGQGRLWAVYVHPLAELHGAQLIEGIAQTVNLARSYGTLYTSGSRIFGGGDSPGIYRDLLEDLLQRGQPL